MRLGLAITLLVLAGCAEVETPRSQTREGQPVAAPFVEIVCTKDGDTRLWTPVVEVQPDGVHVDIENRAGQASIDDFPLDVGRGRHNEVVTVPPGKMKVACNPFNQHGSSNKPVKFDLRLVDPEGHWISTELECKTDMVVGSTQYASPSSDQDPIAMVQESVNGLEPDDVVEVAGYPKAAVPTVRIVRDDKIIGFVGFVEAGDGGLMIEGTSFCASEGLRW